MSGAPDPSSAWSTYAAGLLAAITAPSPGAMAAVLAGIQPPQDPGGIDQPALPQRPGRPAHFREGPAGGRRRGSLAKLGARRSFLHAIFHIELTAVDLACALLLRARGAPVALHREMLEVAREEAVHAGWLEAWLLANGAPPGSYPIHHRLWDAARACDSLGEQLVVVSRYLEARGLDVSVAVLPRLALADAQAGEILARIYADEVRHVATGTRWHRWWCASMGLDPEDHFAEVVRRRFPDQLPSPFVLDRAGRGQAGFSPAELALLESPLGVGSKASVYDPPSSTPQRSS